MRRAEPDDALSLFALAADAEVMHFMDWPMPTEVGATRTHLEQVHASWDAGHEFQWIALERQTGACAGTISVRIKGHAADFGYFFGRRFWGRCLAFDAATAVLRWLDTQPQILRVWATVDSENVRSRRLLERLELQFEGTMRCATLRPNIGGSPRDTAVYARVKE